MQLETKLARRVEEAIRQWTCVFENGEEAEELRENNVALPPMEPVQVEVGPKRKKEANGKAKIRDAGPPHCADDLHPTDD